MNYDEAWIYLYSAGQRISLKTGAMFKVESKPIVRFELVLYERFAGFTVTPVEWSVAGDEEGQRALLREKLDLAERRLFERDNGR